ncbi:otoferlin-like isoform X1 [Hermetia illucens]|uniref:otoferlin-like isoform X1 n=2 Tax=Hermetia illucens TaxID=343691 RepID=UPI0018CBFCAE|nr:otoferlin-like isoform X1 [Hermetia illucens]XP_037920163.1 otoferlin-like isoform X1 [Hermetia illucens]XP_037920164.1 otoferlin-like isoform X1 [Hermetia illucens]XP_037920166.1 otoferlin-like isoform X1 [Hermetia illucens]
MSLTVKLIQFRLAKSKSNLIGRVEFRGVAHTTTELNSSSDTIDVNQSFIWPLARPASPEENVIVELRSQTTKILLKTGLATSSTSRGGSGGSRGTISSSSKCIGQYVILMQGLIAEGNIRVEDRLVDLCANRPIEAIVVFEAKYISPDDAAGNFEPTNLVKPIQEVHNTNSMDDDQQMLLDIEQNIANLEKSLQRDNQQETPSKKRHILKRVISSSQGNGYDRNDGKLDKAGKSSSREKKMTLRTVRNLMKLGKQRPRSQSRDSSTEDEGRSPLIVETDQTGLTSATDGEDDSKSQMYDTGQSNASSDGEEEKHYDKGKIVKVLARTDDHLKSQDFQVCVTIIEARQLPGLNMDPVVCIQIGDQKKYTSVKESTNCPYFNEYFVFDFHMPPVMLFDKIITLSVLQSRSVLRPNKLIGTFKLDIATVWNQKDHQFYHKWALLSDPDDFISGPKGYLKCDIGIIGKGDTVKVPQKSEKDPDDIEANLLLPDGVPIERQRAKFIVKIYRADGLPRMNSSLMANVKKAFTGESKDLVSPYVQVSFAGLSGKTTVKKNAYAPVWNEQLVFTEMFPPLCQRIKIQLRDADPMKPSIIGTHYIDLKQISNDGEKGFLPTFGPSFIHLYGSTRDYSLLDQHSNLNTGLGEGVSYRARLLLAIRTEIADNIETSNEKNVELEPAYPISESSYSKNEEFFLFTTILEASMLDKKVSDKTVYFELSMGNAGNSLDGHNESYMSPEDEDGELESVDTASYNSTTGSCKPISHDKAHYYLPYWDYKPCMDVRCCLPDLRRRMYNSNMIAKMADKLEDDLSKTRTLIEEEDPKIEVKLRNCLEEFAISCSKYLTITKSNIMGPGSGKTKLDKERMKLCQREIESLGNMARNLRALVTKNSAKERFRTAQTYLQKIKFLVDDPQDSLPDIFIWLIANGKRYAYHRMSARDLIYSPIEEECGIYCSKVQTIFLKLPGKQSNETSGWFVQAKLTLYLWLGAVSHKQYFFEGLPQGYDLSQELRNADRSRALAPSNIHYLEKHVFQLRAHIYQARSLIGSDASGLSDPYAIVFITEYAKSTQVIEETLSPTWDELLVFDEILVYGAKDQIKKDPPTITIEIYDQDKVGKSEFIGRAIAKPRVKLKDNAYVTPALEWFDIFRGTDNAGELLAAFEMLEMGSTDIPRLTEPKFMPIETKKDRTYPPPQTILPVPRDVRPHLARFKLEVLFWGLRDLKRIHFMSVDKPRIDVECSGKILGSSIIQNARKNPNFPNMLKSIELELPVEETYAPPITIRCVDCRSFGRYTLVGTHQITSIHRYMYKPPPKEDLKNYQTMGGQIILAAPTADSNEDQTGNQVGHKDQNVHKSSSCENLTIYGAACVTKMVKRQLPKRKQPPPEPKYEDEMDDDNSKDWWTKYFWSYEKLIEDSKTTTNHLKLLPNHFTKEDKPKLGVKGSKLVSKLSPKHHKKEIKSSTALCQIYPNDLESQLEFNNFKEWLHSFALYRGKKTGDSTEDESRIVGYFKGAIKVYKLPLPKGAEANLNPSLPGNDPIHVLVRIYIVKATDLHPMDLNGKADPYVVLHLGNKRISDKENYVSKQLNPIFGKCFEVEATFPQDSMLTVQILDWDLVGSDDLIGETKIDLENRFYSKHRATCGLAFRYEDSGYNRWRDPMKPTQILSKLCKENKLETPHYFQDHVVIGKYCMTFSEEEVIAWNGPTTCKYRDEHLALAVLHRWQEIPKVGCKIVPEHIESRSLYNPDKPGIEQGKLEMWVDMFPMDMPLPGPPVDISPRKPTSYELRVVIWNTDDVVLEDDAFFTGEKMSDIYVKGWLKGPQDIQATDIHYRSLTGEGNFNWRFIFPFEYLAAEERIVLSRKESLFSWDETEVKIPARLELQVWDADHFSADDFLGAISLNLNRFPRGAKSSKLCTLDMLKTDNVPTVNIFKQKRVRGWWPFFIKKQNDEMELTGKVEAEFHLLTKEEAEQSPAGYGRNEPDPLEKPNRPDASFMWFLNPLKSIRYIVWHNYKWAILKGFILVCLTIMILLFFYAVPGYTVKKMLGA